MTIPLERTNAVLMTEQFLLELSHGKTYKVPKAVRQHAKMLLRHYPNRYDLHVAALSFNSGLVDSPFSDPEQPDPFRNNSAYANYP